MTAQSTPSVLAKNQNHQNLQWNDISRRFHLQPPAGESRPALALPPRVHSVYFGPNRDRLLAGSTSHDPGEIFCCCLFLWLYF